MDEFDQRQNSSHQKMVQAIGKNKTVLDIGCEKGYIAKRLKQNGCTVTGIEIDEKLAKEAAKICDWVYLDNVESTDWDFEKEEFDIILFGDILEHLNNPLKVLNKLKPFLKNNGKIIISIPNIANWKIRLKLLFGKFDYADSGILDKTHMRFFTKKSLKELIQQANFQITKEDHTPSFPFPFFKKQLAKIRPEAFAFQFIITAKKKVQK